MGMIVGAAVGILALGTVVAFILLRRKRGRSSAKAMYDDETRKAMKRIFCEYE